MSITSAIVLFAVIWFMVFLIVLPLRLVTQGDAGELVPGTHKSAPVDPQLKRRAKITTVWAIGLWAVIAGVLLSGLLTVESIDMFNRMGPGSGLPTAAQ
ncbi:DUF1467 family protein [Nereida sp. MMG025]|uniref:DUF1467 family protein n=1 Tax=Nereida sp. MMG025 TaxID=2909981 RepID=UPI001F27DC90|nr:DUF1467 family protein [Nereida sp. MMG025]MCF6444055.1 DUF1467 family protein [Nereida sp. MMG025]